MPTGPLEIGEIPQSRSGEMNHFFDLPFQLYAQDRYFVPRLRLELKDLFSPKNPFFLDAEIKIWLAKDNDKIVGRIVGIINHAHNRFHNERCAFFGFFEAIDDLRVAQALLQKVEDYAKQQGMEILRGPTNFSTNHDCGLLIEGFNDPPQIMMPYNPPYYQKLLEDCGLKKAIDLLALRLPTNLKLPERIAKIVERTEKSKAITYRPINKKKWNQEMAAMFEIYNDAWEKNWGFVPFTWEEFKHVGDSLKMVVKEELVVFVEVAGEPAAFAVTLPDYNQVFKKITNGRLFPTGFYHLLRADHTINRLRVITLGIRKKFGHLGLGGLMYNYLVNTSHRMGYIDAELSWILETNTSMINPMKLMGAELIKKYRLFEKRLDLQ